MQRPVGTGPTLPLPFIVYCDSRFVYSGIEISRIVPQKKAVVFRSEAVIF